MNTVPWVTEDKNLSSVNSFYLQDLQGSDGGLCGLLLSQVCEAYAEGEVLGEGGVLQLGLRLFHQGLQDGRRHLVVAGTHADQPTGKGCHTNL